MRRPLFAFVVLALAVSSATGVHASTDCERWLADYKKSLDHNPTVARVNAARHRAHAYARRTVAQLTGAAPAHKPPVSHASSTRPRLTPRQMLSKFEILCGELPVSPTDQVLDSRMAPEEFISELALGGPLDVETLPADSLIPTEVPPTFVSSVAVPSTPGDFTPVWPIYGPLSGGLITGPLIPTAPTSPTSPTSPTGPTTPIIPVVPVTPLPPVSSIPEPSSIVLLLTGGGSGVLALRRRRLSRLG